MSGAPRRDPAVIRGAALLRRLLEEQCFDVRELDEPGFADWLARQLARWNQNPEFALRSKIRDLRRSHPLLRSVEREHRRLLAADSAAPDHADLQRVTRFLENVNKAIAGLSGAVQCAAPDHRAPLEEKLHAFHKRRQTLEEEHRRRIDASPTHQARLRAGEELERLRKAIGLEDAEARLATLQKERGQRSGRAGSSFEQLTLERLQTTLIPEFSARFDGSTTQPLQVLSGVTLGAARIEIDALIVRQPPGEGEPAEVLALVEAKRNINDLAHGFRHRQQNLAWLTGFGDGYDWREYQNTHFPTGHFDRAAIDDRRGRRFVFTRASFRNFTRDPTTGYFLDRLYLLTRSGPIWGISGAALHRLSFRVASDARWQPDDPESMRRLWHWCRGLTHAIETPDVLRVYAASEERAKQILVAV